MADTINPNISQLLDSKAYKIKPLKYYVDGIIKDHDFLVLAEAITLLESEAAEHKALTSQLLVECYKAKCPSRRIGITGSPGVGKSSFIESMAEHLKKEDTKVAILSIDPSSTDNRGSILGDKTRMNQLSQNADIFIRPSPSRAHLGGANAYTYEAIVMCEAAGIELILIETVGVGQSEHEIKQMVDGTLLLLLPGSGDDLQGIKKGITEIADIVIIHKADGERKTLADQSRKDYRDATHYARALKSQWVIPVVKYSSLTGEGASSVIDAIDQFFNHIIENSYYASNRKFQIENWLSLRVTQHCQDSIENELKKINLIDSKNENQSPFEQLSMIKSKLQIHLKYS